MRRTIGAALAALFSVIMFAGAPASAAPAGDGVGILAVVAVTEYPEPGFPLPGVLHSWENTLGCQAVAIPTGVRSATNHVDNGLQVRYFSDPNCTTLVATIADGAANPSFTRAFSVQSP